MILLLLLGGVIIMSKNIKSIIICLSIIIFTALLFLAIDCFRLTNNQKTIFSMSLGQYLDGGTKEYYGLGYKIIDRTESTYLPAWKCYLSRTFS